MLILKMKILYDGGFSEAVISLFFVGIFLYHHLMHMILYTYKRHMDKK